MRYFLIFRCQKLIRLTILYTWIIIIVKYLHKFKSSMWANNTIASYKKANGTVNECENMLQALALLKEKWDYTLL